MIVSSFQPDAWFELTIPTLKYTYQDDISRTKFWHVGTDYLFFSALCFIKRFMKKNISTTRVIRLPITITISAQHVLSAYHCTFNPEKSDGESPCDHSDGSLIHTHLKLKIILKILLRNCLNWSEKRLAVLGRNSFKFEDIDKYYSIPIIGNRQILLYTNHW